MAATPATTGAADSKATATISAAAPTTNVAAAATPPPADAPYIHVRPDAVASAAELKAAASALVATSLKPTHPAITAFNGSIAGAKVCFLAPSDLKEWNGLLLVHAHGCRPVGISLVADLSPDSDELYRVLVAEGKWVVGMTSYRREGLIVRDAITDVDNVVLLAAATFGTKPTTVVVEGESMGGAIATLLSECRTPTDAVLPYHGILAVGAALLVREPPTAPYTTRVKFNRQPRVPLLYLNTTDEVDEVDRYCAGAMKRSVEPDRPPHEVAAMKRQRAMRKAKLKAAAAAKQAATSAVASGTTASSSSTTTAAATAAPAPPASDSDDDDWSDGEPPDVDDENSWRNLPPHHPVNPGHYGTALKVAHWYVRRNGHCNVNAAERWRALNALLQWIARPPIAASAAIQQQLTSAAAADTKAVTATSAPATASAAATPTATPPPSPFVMPLVHDATVVVIPPPSADAATVAFDDGGVWGQVTETDAWGDVRTNLTAAHLHKVGAVLGKPFHCELGGVRFKAPGKSFKVVYGANSYLSVGQGQWYAYEHADGYVRLSANGYAHPHLVTAEAGVRVGAAVYVARPVGVGAGLNGIPTPANDKNMARVAAERAATPPK